jgi:hypothetical protein
MRTEVDVYYNISVELLERRDVALVAWETAIQALKNEETTETKAAERAAHLAFYQARWQVFVKSLRIYRDQPLPAAVTDGLSAEEYAAAALLYRMRAGLCEQILADAKDFGISHLEDYVAIDEERTVMLRRAAREGV